MVLEGYFAYELKCVHGKGSSLRRPARSTSLFTSTMYNIYIYLRCDKSCMNVKPATSLLNGVYCRTQRCKLWIYDLANTKKADWCSRTCESGRVEIYIFTVKIGVVGAIKGAGLDLEREKVRVTIYCFAGWTLFQYFPSLRSPSKSVNETSQ